MSEKVTVLGAGNMGSALARAFLHAGHVVTVWNRTAERCRPLVDLGALQAGSAADAVAASKVSVACVADYEALRDALNERGATTDLEGRTLVNLSTGTPEQAAEMRDHVVGRGAAYLDGAIPAYPRTVGDRDEMIIFSGDPEVWHAHRPLLLALGGSSMHVGDDVQISNVLDLALVGGFYHVAYAGFLEAAAYATALGARIEELLPLASRLARELLVETLSSSTRAIADARHTTDQATIDVHLDAMLMIQASMRECGQQARLMDAVVAYLQQVRDAGRGDEAMSSLFESLAVPAGD